jgi:two-component system chemotaxis response regulator CheB
LQPPIRVLVVDDSAFMRYTISKRLSETYGLSVAGIAHDGDEALALIPTLDPDVITLDVEMPNTDGLTTLRQIMTRFPRPVVMLSSLTKEGANETVQALTLGAVDFIAKPDTKANIDAIMGDVIEKIQRAARARVNPMPPAHQVKINQPSKIKTHRPLRRHERVVVIGSSTGGPRALNTIITRLPPDLPAAVLVVQHMPVGFTRSLAERLDGLSEIAVKEATPGDDIESGQVLLAPGGFHMTIDPQGQISVNQNPPVHGVRPAVDVTMISASQRFGSAVVGVVLTGMGSDGTNGAVLVHSSGGHVIAEAESSCVVYGMPRGVVEAGAADEVLVLQDISSAIERAVIR